MLFKSPIFSQVSGSSAGNTFSHNRGGLYVRARTVPVNPNSPAQNQVRVRLAALMNRWTNILTQAQRDEWDTYALNVPLPGPLGDLRNAGGTGMFIRGNTPRLQAALAPADAGPAIFALGEFTEITAFAPLAATNAVGFAFSNTDAWANELGGAMLVFASRPQQPAKNYFTGPYRFVDKILGDDITPPSSPFSPISPFPFVVGQRIFLRVNIVRADGRLANSQRLTALAV